MLSFYLAILESDQDKALFETLYNKCHKSMEQAAIRILKKQQDAEDAVQNAFVQIIRHFEKLSTIPCEEWKYWTISIVRNEALMLLRKRKDAVPLEDWDGFESSVDEVTDYKDLVQLFTKLPATYRSVLELKFILGLSDKEIAAKLNISETAVSTRVNRGRKLLQELVIKGGFYR